MCLKHSDGPRELQYRQSIGQIRGCYKDTAPFSRVLPADSSKFVFCLAFALTCDVVLKKIRKNDAEQTCISY